MDIDPADVAKYDADAFVALVADLMNEVEHLSKNQMFSVMNHASLLRMAFASEMRDRVKCCPACGHETKGLGIS